VYSVLVGEREDVLGVGLESGPGRPSVVAYWCAEEADDELPPSAILLGSVSSSERRYALPVPATSRSGFVVFFSLGHGEVVTSVALAAEAR
jgi:hypothetical protein